LSDHRRLRVLGFCGLSAFAAVLLAACAGGSSSQGTAAAGGSQPGRAGYTAQQLRGALLTSVDGARPAAAVQVGRYGSLRGVKDTQDSMRGLRIIPARCARAARTGLDSAALSAAPATVVSFRHGSGGVSEVLIAPRGALAVAALGSRIPRGCTHYSAVVGGRTYAYTVKEEPAPPLGRAAREIRVHASGATTVDVWTVIYRTNGYVGAVTTVGSAGSRMDIESIARAAYDKAQRTLQ